MNLMRLSLLTSVYPPSFPLPSSSVFFYLAKPGFFRYNEVVFKALRGRLNPYQGGQKGGSFAVSTPSGDWRGCERWVQVMEETRSPSGAGAGPEALWAGPEAGRAGFAVSPSVGARSHSRCGCLSSVPLAPAGVNQPSLSKQLAGGEARAGPLRPPQ